MAVACVCFIGKQNEPLSLQVFNSDDDLSMQFAAYAALDIVEEKVQAQESLSSPYGPTGGAVSSLPPSSADCYLGVICPALCLNRDYLFHAYVCTTGVKILVAIEQRNHYLQHDVRNLFRRLHRLYADTICNPFLLDTIETPEFLSELDAIVEFYGKKLEGGGH
ncbi:putative Sedlin, N-terminal region protein [Toxoplasma gondii TgCatPRC2]|uniref:Trafficking protein particle complex subunit 2-like protein n=15 Tax=Toxoplasma gondii TaxID=5811 RepID=A0A125YYL9_TOXGV|nr:Sedlin, N-terminal region protein, putative [Toxoplasma gondii ME49]EPR58860.1 putative Sedlin protein [Toxoplasma gondii GT1]ESS35411.1 putative Sedlin, N-terminal region protein [Toxoplasma gondii VEG]KAF4639598.1 putative Sedlin [Toxoplasma gondii]KFG37048.1 putative Sedlin, N-terminal region protein [Toxoplasma gondii GAB2-2007-GAL-DOM2]KFG49765.1 putative Sedlin, N-terminal region protein [Toxoplasma gondii p89]KFG56261.1 putative Sedlin, N-terminal region protein [Toxoplasma gondii F|eukprot:XP_018635360.1 Sedlin, N-terminal region protein, putative [Toxoplasma gondii ME49]